MRQNDTKCARSKKMTLTQIRTRLNTLKRKFALPLTVLPRPHPGRKTHPPMEHHPSQPPTPTRNPHASHPNRPNQPPPRNHLERPTPLPGPHPRPKRHSRPPPNRPNPNPSSRPPRPPDPTPMGTTPPPVPRRQTFGVLDLVGGLANAAFNPCGIGQPFRGFSSSGQNQRVGNT